MNAKVKVKINVRDMCGTVGMKVKREKKKRCCAQK